MGNCLACFKEPDTNALDNSLNYRKEEMPEAQLYPAPSHIPASSAPTTETVILLSNGNHIPAVAIVPPPTTTLVPTNTTLSSFYQTRRPVLSSSITGMGLTETKQPSEARLNALFDQYKDTHDDSVLAEGIEALCRDLQMRPDDFRILLLAWKLNAEQMCRFTRDEWLEGLRTMRVDTVKGMQAKLPEIVKEVEQNTDQFKDLYRFTFRFGLDTAAGQRILPTDMAIVLWRLVFTVRSPPILGRWLAFLERHQTVRGIPRDTWNMFLNFAEAVGNDLSCYDDSEAWPCLFDDFVEWENDQANQNISKEKECDGVGDVIIGRGGD